MSSQTHVRKKLKAPLSSPSANFSAHFNLSIIPLKFTILYYTIQMATSSTGGSSNCDGSGKKVRKPYTITKSREIWTDEEHDKFLEALQLFDRDWKKIEDFVGSKTVIQIRSHAQKYFLKVQKNGAIAHVPPARPKRKAAHPYPHKATKAVSTLPLGIVSWDETPMLMSSAPTKSIAFQDDYSILLGAEDIGSKGVGSICRKSANSLGNSVVALQSSDISKQGKQASILHGTPDFKQVYSFIGSIFDLGTVGLSQKLKEMDPINHETVLLLMENLTLNMTNPDFEQYSKALISHEANTNEERVAVKNQMTDEPC